MKPHIKYGILALCVSLVVFMIMCGGTTIPSEAKGKPPTKTPPGATSTPSGPTPTPGPATPIQIYGAWHCGDDYCIWTTIRDMVEFDQKNHWLIDRGDGVPSVNLVILSFLNPLQLLNQTNDAQTVDGVPVGMTQEVVDYFKDQGIRVMMSIGSITYVDDWNDALAADATQFGLNAAEVAQQFGVGIEIDYEENQNPNLVGLQAFVDAYRSVLPRK